MLTLTRNDIGFIVILIVASILAYHLDWPIFRWVTSGPKRLGKAGKRAEGAFVLSVIEQAGKGVTSASDLSFAEHASNATDDDESTSTSAAA